MFRTLSLGMHLHHTHVIQPYLCLKPFCAPYTLPIGVNGGRVQPSLSPTGCGEVAPTWAGWLRGRKKSRRSVDFACIPMAIDYASNQVM